MTSDEKHSTLPSSIQTAVISVSDKTGVVGLARELAALGVAIYSTGGTFKALVEGGVAAQPVEELTGFPEILGGRVKSLHPGVFGGILARRDEAGDLDELEANKLSLVDLVVVNLYPFEEVAQRAGATDAEIIENIDIGGVSMLRAAAKNYRHVAALVDPADYSALIAELQTGEGQLSLETRRRLAGKVFARCRDYDTAIARYFESGGSQ